MEVTAFHPVGTVTKFSMERDLYLEPSRTFEWVLIAIGATIVKLNVIKPKNFILRTINNRINRNTKNYCRRPVVPDPGSASSRNLTYRLSGNNCLVLIVVQTGCPVSSNWGIQRSFPFLWWSYSFNVHVGSLELEKMNATLKARGLDKFSLYHFSVTFTYKLL